MTYIEAFGKSMVALVIIVILLALVLGLSLGGCNPTLNQAQADKIISETRWEEKLRAYQLELTKAEDGLRLEVERTGSLNWLETARIWMQDVLPAIAVILALGLAIGIMIGAILVALAWASRANEKKGADRASVPPEVLPAAPAARPPQPMPGDPYATPAGRIFQRNMARQNELDHRKTHPYPGQKTYPEPHPNVNLNNLPLAE
jgi:flagellar basal body-associated protein FliL